MLTAFDVNPSWLQSASVLFDIESKFFIADFEAAKIPKAKQ